MKLSVFKAYLKKEFLDLVRSKMIILTYVIPFLIMVLFGNGIKLDVSNIRLGIVDYEHSKYSYDIVSTYKSSKYFSVEVIDNEKEGFKALKNGQKDVLMIIPHNFSKDLINKNAEIGVFVDGAFTLRSQTIEAYVNGVLLSNFGGKLNLDYRFFFNESMRNQNAIVPGLIGIAMLVAPAILAVLMIVKEKEAGTIFNFYSSPVNRFTFFISKLIPVFLIHFVNIFILLLVTIYIFDVPFKGSFLLYLLAGVLYVLISAGIGLLVSIITSSQVVALVIVILITIIPGFMYSGMLMPINSMGSEAFIQAHIFPTMYFNHLIYDSFLGGLGFDSPKNILYLAILFLYAVVLLFLGAFFLKKGTK